MPAHGRRSPARFIAPLALLVCAAAVFAVIAGAGKSGDDTSETGSGTESTSGPTTGATTTQATTTKRIRANYTIQTGDTLGAIAEKTGTTVDELLTLNPELDPQALVAGQRIKLRE